MRLLATTDINALNTVLSILQMKQQRILGLKKTRSRWFSAELLAAALLTAAPLVVFTIGPLVRMVGNIVGECQFLGLAAESREAVN